MAYICDHKDHGETPEKATRLIRGTVVGSSGTRHEVRKDSCANAGHVADLVGKVIPFMHSGSKMTITIEAL